MRHEDCCLVVDRFGNWRVEEYTVPPRIPDRFDWSSELRKPYMPPRRVGPKLKLRPKAKYLESTE